jgi:hypothetical protein
MITFSNNVVTALADPVIESFYLVRLGHATPVYKTSYFRDLIMSDGNTYLSDGALVNIDPPRLSSEVDREIFKIVLTDVGVNLATLINDGLVGTSVEARLGFVNQSTRQPYQDIADTVIVYKGRVDSVTRVITTENIGEIAYTLECSSPMGDLDLVRTYLTTQDYLDKKYPGDNSYELIFVGAGPVNLKWGKR